jgi:hypothetical protein
MFRITAALFALPLAALAVAGVDAQTKVIPGEHRTAFATVESVDPVLGRVTLRMSNGDMRTLSMPQAKRLGEIKKGDTVKATYYENIVLRAKPAGEPDVDTVSEARTPGTGARPGATVATQQTITATIAAIDLKAGSIAFKGPRTWSYETKVQDPKALAQVKVGDRVDITWSEATLVEVGAAKK